MQLELVLNGFDGATDKTDHLIKWVSCLNLVQIKTWLAKKGFDSIVKEVHSLRDESETPLTFADGIDVILDNCGEPERGDIEIATGLWEITVEPQNWKEEVEKVYAKTS